VLCGREKIGLELETGREIYKTYQISGWLISVSTQPWRDIYITVYRNKVSTEICFNRNELF